MRNFWWALLVIWLLPGQAAAHPHVWVKYEATMAETAKGAVLRLRLTVRTLLDVVMGQEMLLSDGSTGQPLPRAYPLNEIAREEQRLASTAPFQLYWQIDGAAPQLIELVPAKLQARRATDAKGELLTTYEWEQPLPEGAQSVGFALYDPTFYVAVAAAADLGNATSWRCEHRPETIGQTIWGPLTTQFYGCQRGSGRAPNFAPPPLPPMQPDAREGNPFFSPLKGLTPPPPPTP